MNALDFLVDFVTVPGAPTAPQTPLDTANNGTPAKRSASTFQEPSMAPPYPQSSNDGNASGPPTDTRQSPPLSSAHHDMLKAAFADANEKLLDEYTTRPCRNYEYTERPRFEQYSYPQIHGNPHCDPTLGHHELYQRQHPVWRPYDYTPGCTILAARDHQGPPRLRSGPYETQDAVQLSMLEPGLLNGPMCHYPLYNFRMAPMGAANGHRDSVDLPWNHMDERAYHMWQEAVARGYIDGFGRVRQY